MRFGVTVRKLNVTDGQRDKTDGQTDGCTDGWMDGRTHTGGGGGGGGRCNIPGFREIISKTYIQQIRW